MHKTRFFRALALFITFGIFAACGNGDDEKNREAARKALDKAKQERAETDATEKKRLAEEKRENEIVEAKSGLAILKGEVALPQNESEGQAGWISAIKSGEKKFPPACDAYIRFSYGETLKQKLESENSSVNYELLEIKKEDFDKLLREKGFTAAKHLLAAAANPPDEKISCQYDNEQVALDDVFDTVDKLVDLLEKLDATPKDIGTTPGKIREYMAREARAVAKELMPSIDESQEARKKIIHLKKTYEFSAKELGLTKSEAAKLFDE